MVDNLARTPADSQRPPGAAAHLPARLPAFAAQVLHRDIKPGNIMVTNQDVVKIGDLGIAKILKGRHRRPPP